MYISDIKELDEKIRECKGVFIYGAGARGKCLLKYLQLKRTPVDSFIVTCIEKPYYADGILVQCFWDVLEECKNHTVIVAGDRRNIQDITKCLDRGGVRDYIIVDEELFPKLRKVSYDYIASTRVRNVSDKDDGKLRIGYLSPGYMELEYPEKRLIINKLKPNVAKYEALPKELPELAGCSWVDGWYEPSIYKPDVNVVHTFNTVCVTEGKWCASFETRLPRSYGSDDDTKALVRRLSENILKGNCLGTLCLCKSAYGIQQDFLKDFVPDMVDEIMKKTRVLHPPQEILLTSEEEEEKCAREVRKIVFVFTGRGFFFKGGREVVNALSRFEGKYPFRLILISSLSYGDYFTHATYDEMIKYRKVVKEKSWIEYYDNLPNDKVLEKCKEADIGLLPSFADTYGFAALEMQAGGCPTITTNIMAFPEINNDSCGWICKLPTDSNNCCRALEMPVLSNILESELVSIFEWIFEHPEAIAEKRKAALERIRAMHDPDAYAERLNEIYKA